MRDREVSVVLSVSPGGAVPARARVYRVRCWPLSSVRNLWRWMLPTSDGGVLCGEAATWEDAMWQLQPYRGVWDGDAFIERWSTPRLSVTLPRY